MKRQFENFHLIFDATDIYLDIRISILRMKVPVSVVFNHTNMVIAKALACDDKISAA